MCPAMNSSKYRPDMGSLHPAARHGKDTARQVTTRARGEIDNGTCDISGAPGTTQQNPGQRNVFRVPWIKHELRHLGGKYARGDRIDGDVLTRELLRQMPRQ